MVQALKCMVGLGLGEQDQLYFGSQNLGLRIYSVRDGWMPERDE